MKPKELLPKKNSICLNANGQAASAHSFHLNAQQHMEQHMALGNRMCGVLGQLLFISVLVLDSTAW